MLRLGKKTTCAVAIFSAMATTLMFTGCADMLDDAASDQTEQKQKNDSTMLKDQNGDYYMLYDNGDGTETAAYVGGDSVTFQRDEAGNLTALTGDGNLLPALAAGYFLSHHLITPPGSWYDASAKRYVSNGKPEPQFDEENQGTSSTGGYIPYYGGTSYDAGSRGDGNTAGKTNVAAPVGAKTGFGSAGVRGGAS